MLIIKTTCGELLKQLQMVSGIINPKAKGDTALDKMLSSVLIECVDGEFRFTSCNLELQIRSASLPCEPVDFKTTTASKKLLALLRELPADAAVTLETLEVQGKTSLVLKSGKSRFILQTLPAEDFPSIKSDEYTTTEVAITSGVLKDMLSQVQFSMGVNDIRYMLNGMLFQIQNNNFNLVSTDNHRMTFTSTSMENAEGLNVNVILPRITIIQLSKLLKEAGEQVTMTFLMKPPKKSSSKNAMKVGEQDFYTLVRFNIGNIEVLSSVIDGQFPDYNRVINIESSSFFNINRLDLMNALSRVGVVVMGNNSIRTVKMEVANGVLSLSCSHLDDEGFEDIEMDYQGEKAIINVNISYMMDVLSNMDSEEIKFTLNQRNPETQAMLITQSKYPNYKHVVMPIRV